MLSRCLLVILVVGLMYVEADKLYVGKERPGEELELEPGDSFLRTAGSLLKPLLGQRVDISASRLSGVFIEEPQPISCNFWTIGKITYEWCPDSFLYHRYEEMFARLMATGFGLLVVGQVETFTTAGDSFDHLTCPASNHASCVILTFGDPGCDISYPGRQRATPIDVNWYLTRLRHRGYSDSRQCRRALPLVVRSGTFI